MVAVIAGVFVVNTAGGCVAAVVVTVAGVVCVTGVATVV